MFAVDDVARAVEECKALGEDPEGNQFILHKRKAG